MTAIATVGIATSEVELWQYGASWKPGCSRTFNPIASDAPSTPRRSYLSWVNAQMTSFLKDKGINEALTLTVHWLLSA